MEKPRLKPLIWVGDSKERFAALPDKVQDLMGYAPYRAQVGEKHPRAKPWKGFGGAGVLEVVDDFQTDTYRTVYTVKLPRAVYVLHAFQKKSKKGIATPKHEAALVKARYRPAQAIDEREFGPSGGGKA